MTTPEEKRWGEIKKALAAIGINADAITIDVHKGKRSLREVLEREAECYAKVQNFKEPTARQRNEMIEEVLTEIDALRNRFARWTDADGREYLPYVARYASEMLIEEAEAGLAALAEDLRSFMVANPKHNTHGAAKLERNHCWFTLSKIFVRRVVPPPHPAQNDLRQPLIRFLRAVTGDTSKKAIDNFVNRKALDPRAIAAWKRSNEW
jgi:hypothetical protein